MYLQKYRSLWVCSLDKEAHKRTCDYWYTVTADNYAHTAFHEKEHLLAWLEERGLLLSEPLPEQRGIYQSQHVIGGYNLACYLGDVEEFTAIVPIRKIAELCNANYTLGKVTKDESGTHTVHFLNPNVYERIVFPYSVMRSRQPSYQQLIDECPDMRPNDTDTSRRLIDPWNNSYDYLK